MRFRPSPQLVRLEYEQLRTTSSFKRWRARQYKRQFGFCAYGLHRLGRGYHCDHLRAIGVGGSNSYFNLILACSRCNLFKSDKVLTRPYEVLVRVRLLPATIVYELWALLVMFIQAFYTTPKR